MWLSRRKACPDVPSPLLCAELPLDCCLVGTFCCRQLKYELDFTNEARNAAQLAQCMAGRPDVAVPRTYPALCTPRVLAMEWIEGCKVT